MCSLYSSAVTDDVYLHHQLRDSKLNFIYLVMSIIPSSPQIIKGFRFFMVLDSFFSVLLQALDCILLNAVSLHKGHISVNR
jgi:hypothetical protein